MNNIFYVSGRAREIVLEQERQSEIDRERQTDRYTDRERESEERGRTILGLFLW